VNVSPCLDFFFYWHLNIISILRMLRLEPPNAVMKRANNENNLFPPCGPLLLMISLPQLSWTARKIAPSGSRYSVLERRAEKRLQRRYYHGTRLLQLLRYTLGVYHR